MADFSGNADFLLVVGAHVDLSYQQMKEDLSDLVKKLNAQPLRIKVGIDNKALDEMRNQITQLSNIAANTSTVNSVGAADVEGIRKTASAWRALDKAMKQAAESAEQTKNVINRVENATTAKTSATKSDIAEEIKKQTLLKQSYTLLTQLQNAETKWTAAKSGNTASNYAGIQKDIELLNTLISQYGQSVISAEKFGAELKNINSRFAMNSNVIKDAGKNTKTWGERLGALSAKFGTWFSITRVIMAAYRAVRQMVSNVIELDTAMTELRKVTDETDATYEKFLTRATTRAKELGAALADTVSATADFARLGYGIEDAEKLSDAAIVYKNVGDGIEDIGTASESIIATMQAFGISAEDVMSIVDKFNEVGNNYAISSKGVGDALLRSAAAMHAANNTLDETIALATAANTVVKFVPRCYGNIAA